MDNLIVIGILLILVGAAIFYIGKERKKGTRCIGCPSSGCCCGKKSGNMKESCKRSSNRFFYRYSNCVPYGQSFGRDWSYQQEEYVSHYNRKVSRYSSLKI